MAWLGKNYLPFNGQDKKGLKTILNQQKTDVVLRFTYILFIINSTDNYSVKITRKPRPF